MQVINDFYRQIICVIIARVADPGGVDPDLKKYLVRLNKIPPLSTEVNLIEILILYYEFMI